MKQNSDWKSMLMVAAAFVRNCKTVLPLDWPPAERFPITSCEAESSFSPLRMCFSTQQS
jgi:hypothetical protein